MNLNQLKAFSTLSKTLHYSRASEALGIAQPSLSRSINQLEQELGTVLFERQGRNIILTKQGVLFQTHVNNALAELNQGTDMLKELQNPGHGIIDFAFIYALSPSYVPQLIQKFLSKDAYKHIGFHFYQANSRDILQKIKDGIWDIGFCSYIEHEPLVQFRPIATQEYVLMVSLKHPLAKRSSVTLEEAAAYDFILPLDKTSYVEQLFQNAHITPKATSRVEEDHAAAALVSINLGIAIIPNNPFLTHYNVKLIPFGPKRLYRTFYMATSLHHQFTPAAHEFYQFLLKESAKELPSF